MPEPNAPGIYVEETTPTTARIVAVPTSKAAFIGRSAQGPVGEPITVRSVGEYRAAFGTSSRGMLDIAIELFFANGGTEAVVVRLYRPGPATSGGRVLSKSGPSLAGNRAVGEAGRLPLAAKGLTPYGDAGPEGLPLDAACFKGDNGGIRALDKVPFNLLYIPPYREGEDVELEVLTAAAAYCRERSAVLIVDAPRTWSDAYAAERGVGDIRNAMGVNAKNAAIYYPLLLRRTGTGNMPVDVPPGAAVAGIIARIDAQRGVWKAPAGLEAQVRGVDGTAVHLTDIDLDRLSPLAINGLKAIPSSGVVVWGARTLDGTDGAGSEWKYLPIRRLYLFIQESLRQGLMWTAFEPNNEALWSRVRMAVGEFLSGLFRQGAFQGSDQDDAYFFKCDRETTTQEDVYNGWANLVVGFAPLKPAEFVVMHVQLRTTKTGNV